MNDDLISRSELKKKFQAILDRGDMFCEYDMIGIVDNAPTVEITEEQAIDKLHETGWLPRHDKEMTDSRSCTRIKVISP